MQKITVRKSEDRGAADHGWLKAKHTFSFANYYDPDFMSYRTLRVINDDRIAGHKGFGMHPHDNMEIFTYIISGQLEHKDSMGNGRVINAGEFQYMSAGSGVYHSEVNPSDQETHLLQIWITPNLKGGDPKYAELDTNALPSDGGLTLFASSDGRHNSVSMRQDAEIYYGKIEDQSQIQVPASTLDGLWLHLIHGEIHIMEETLSAGDGAAIETAGQEISITAVANSEFLLFRLK